MSRLIASAEILFHSTAPLYLKLILLRNYFLGTFWKWEICIIISEMIVIIIIASCRKEFWKTGDSSIIKNIVYQNHFIKCKCVFKIFPVKLLKEVRGVGIITYSMVNTLAALFWNLCSFSFSTIPQLSHRGEQ
jgi:hypothetical protein